jgi:hypothetical protein
MIRSQDRIPTADKELGSRIEIHRRPRPIHYVAAAIQSRETRGQDDERHRILFRSPDR